MTIPRTAAEEYDEIGGRFTRLVEGTIDWDAPTPVDGWAARDVVAHLAGWLPPLLEAGAGLTLAPGPSADDDPVAAWHHVDGELSGLLHDPARARTELVHEHLGRLPVADAVSRFFTADVFQHTWDLATATGQDATLDPARCAEMLEGMSAIEDLLRSSGQYGPAIPVPDEASVQDRFIGFIGRDPGWIPPG